VNDIGTILYGGSLVQGLSLLITIACWFWRRSPAAWIIQAWLLVIGAAACLLTAMVPAGQLFWRIGLSHAASCLANSDCRSEWLFCAGLLAALLSALAIQIFVFALTRSPQATR
jgi:hypothetical protein